MTESNIVEMIATGNVSFGETGAILPADMSFEDWTMLAQKGQLISSAMPWIVGDILTFGADRWPDAWEQALAWTDRSNETLRKWATVARAFSHERRQKYGLKFSYFQAVAFLPAEQADALLQECVDTGMKSDELRKRVQTINGPRTPKLSSQTPADDLVEIQPDDDKPVFDNGDIGAEMAAERGERVHADFEASTDAQALLKIFAIIEKQSDPYTFAERLSGIAPERVQSAASWLSIIATDYARLCKKRSQGAIRTAPEAVPAKAGAQGGGMARNVSSPDHFNPAPKPQGAAASARPAEATGGDVVSPASSPKIPAHDFNSALAASTGVESDGGGSVPRVEPSPVISTISTEPANSGAQMEDDLVIPTFLDRRAHV